MRGSCNKSHPAYGWRMSNGSILLCLIVWGLEQCVPKEKMIDINGFRPTLHRKCRLPIWVEYSQTGQKATDNQSINKTRLSEL